MRTESRPLPLGSDHKEEGDKWEKREPGSWGSLEAHSTAGAPAVMSRGRGQERSWEEASWVFKQKSVVLWTVRGEVVTDGACPGLDGTTTVREHGPEGTAQRCQRAGSAHVS